MRKPLREMKSVRDRIQKTYQDYPLDNQGLIDAALDAAEPVLAGVRAERARLRKSLSSANDEIRRLRSIKAERAHDALDDLTAELDRLRGLLAQAHHLRQHGERAPGGDETWADWERQAEQALRSGETSDA